MIFMDAGWYSVLFWNRFLVIGSSAMPIAFFSFVQEFLSQNKDKWIRFGIFGYIIVQVSNFSGNLITTAYLTDGMLYNEYSSSIILPSLLWVFFIGFSGYELVAKYRRVRDGILLNRIRYLLIVIIVIFAGSLTNATIYKVFPVDIAFNVISALLISYAILKHQLLEISVVVRKGLLYAIPTVIIGASYFLIITLALNILRVYSESEIFFLSLIVAILTALVAQPIRDKAQSWIDKFFFRDRYDSYQMLQRISKRAVSFLDINNLTNMIFAEVTSTLHISRAAFFIKQELTDEFTLLTDFGIDLSPSFSLSSNHPIILHFSKNDEILTRSQVEIMPQFRALWEQERDDLVKIGADLLIPMKVQGELVGIFATGPKRSEETYTMDDHLTLTTMVNQISVAIQNARLYARAQTEISERNYAENQLHLQLQRMSALHTIDMTITSSVNLQMTLEVLLEVTINQLGVDAAAVLLFNQHTNILEYTASKGFLSSTLQHTKLSLGNSLAGRAASKHEIIYVGDLNKESDYIEKSSKLMKEGFVTYFGVPLIAKGKIKGVLEIFHRTYLKSNPEWIDFLKTLATQTAIAVDDAEMFKDLERSNLELIQAYETTLEGWALALELRDQETEGHTRRVTELTIELAKALDLDEKILVHIRHGALLHDIGKMGIPDSILLKPGPLNDEEWVIMKEHPIKAFKLLIKIPFLRPSLDIPQYHHERWDGTGYPSGLKGEEIPLAARIFSVVDVWDALLSDRSYRPAFSTEETMAHIREESGTHFDPDIVEVFFSLLEDKPELFE